MKHILIIGMLLWFGVSSSYAQTDRDSLIIIEEDTPPTMEADSTQKKKNKFKISIDFGDEEDKNETKEEKIGKVKRRNRKAVRTRVFMLDYGISTYLHKGKLNLPNEMRAMDQKLLWSNNWNIHVVKQQVRLDKRNHVNVTYGLSFEFHRYRFTNDYTLRPRESQVTFVENPNVKSFKKNRLNATYLTVPLMLGFRFRPHNSTKSFRLKVGGYGAVLLSGRTKQKSKEFGKVTIDDDFNLSQLRYGLTARLGYGFLEVYARYGLNSFFKDNEKGIYDLQPLSFGIALVPF